MNPYPRQTLIVCIGNGFVSDRSVGCWIHGRLAAPGLPEGVRLLLLPGEGRSLLDALAGEDLLVVVDTLCFGAPPGTVHRFEWPEGSGSAVRVASNEIGVRDAIEVLRSLHPDRIPARVVLIGVEGRFERQDARMDPAVAAGSERALQLIRELIALGS